MLGTFYIGVVFSLSHNQIEILFGIALLVLVYSNEVINYCYKDDIISH